MVINLQAKNHRRRRHDAKKYCMKVRLIADGREVRECVYYDGRRRMLIVNKRDGEGRWYLDPTTWEIATERIKARRVKLVRI